MRRPEITASFDDGLIVDSFSGGGGAWRGGRLELATTNEGEAV